MSKSKSILTILAGLGLPLMTQAQAAESSASLYEQYQLEIVLGVAVLVCFVALLSLVTALYALNTVLNAKKAADAAAAGLPVVGFWQKLWNNMNDAVPIEQEESIMTDHAYDGIRELDNRLPPWWLYGFYLTIVFGVIYVLNFHILKTGDLSAAEYDKEMATAKEQVETYLASLTNLIDETNVTRLEDEASIAAGKTIFTSKCAACHGQQGEGGVGPNMTDSYWLHGGDIQSIFKTIKYGVPAKGMISWQSQLGPQEIQQVASYIYTLEGTNPPNGKEPQGDLFDRGGGAPAATDSTAVVDSTAAIAVAVSSEEKVAVKAGM